jgi:hypothetical protein
VPELTFGQWAPRRTHRGRALARQCQIDLGQSAAFPAQGQMSRGLVALDLDDHLLDQRTMSSFLSRAVVVAALQTVASAGPSVPMRLRSSLERMRGRSSPFAGEQITPGARWRIRLTDELKARFNADAGDGFLPMREAIRHTGPPKRTPHQGVGPTG